MGQVDKLKARQRSNRVDDPHGWAERIENEVASRSLIGGLAFLLSLFLAANVWLLWQQRDNLKERVERLEVTTDMPPEGYNIVP
jgi:hypothetical protein